MEMRDQLASKTKGKIAASIEPYSGFYLAEGLRDSLKEEIESFGLAKRERNIDFSCLRPQGIDFMPGAIRNSITANRGRGIMLSIVGPTGCLKPVGAVSSGQ